MASPPSRLLVPAAAALLLVAPACKPEPKEEGDSCAGDSECATGYCRLETCTRPDGDLDADGLTNARELDLGTDPGEADSDRDGEADLREVGSQGGVPLDCDGDGRIDALERQVDTPSLPGDEDEDGVFDEWDADHVAAFCGPEEVPEVDSEDDLGCRTYRCRPLTHCELGNVADDDRTCDGADDDCDGRTDEEFEEADCVPDDPMQAFCAAHLVCKDGFSSCTVERLAPDNGDVTCDQVDDDCDGQVDEEYRPRACGFGICEGRTECLGGVEECRHGGQPDPGPETLCDGVDSDCDGLTDEDFRPGDVAPCGHGACERLRECVNGELRCPPPPRDVPATDPTCDNIDEDCDGETDDDWPGFGIERPACGDPECDHYAECLGGQEVCEPAEAHGQDPGGDAVWAEHDYEPVPLVTSPFADLRGWHLERDRLQLTVRLELAAPPPADDPGRSLLSYEACLDNTPDAGHEEPGPRRGCDVRLTWTWDDGAGAWACETDSWNAGGACWMPAAGATTGCSRGAGSVVLETDLGALGRGCGTVKLAVWERLAVGGSEELALDTSGLPAGPGVPLP